MSHLERKITKAYLDLLRHVPAHGKHGRAAGYIVKTPSRKAVDAAIKMLRELMEWGLVSSGPLMSKGYVRTAQGEQLVFSKQEQHDEEKVA